MSTVLTALTVSGMAIRWAAVLLVLATPVGCIIQNPNFPQCSDASRGTNVIVAADGTVNLISNASLPRLAEGTSTLYAGPSAASCDFHGVIVVGGPLSLVRTGDLIKLDVAGRALSLLVSDEELQARRAAQREPEAVRRRGYDKLFHDHVLQAPGGVDFDFLQADKAE